MNYILLGNITYNKDEYADAIKCYTVASNSNSKSIKSDAFLNRSLAYKKLGLTHHARNDFSEAIHSSYKNMLVDSVKKKVLISDYDQVNDNTNSNNSSSNISFQQLHSCNSYAHYRFIQKKNKNTCKTNLHSKNQLDNCFSNPGFFLECSKIQDIKDQNIYQYISSYKRHAELNRIDEQLSKMQDAQRIISLGPNNPNYWLIKVRASFNIFQLESALQYIIYAEHQKQQNLSKFDSNQVFNNNSNTQNNSFSDKILKDQNSSNLTINIPDILNHEMNNRLFRIFFNITHGRISEVLYDDPTHPLLLFATREFPVQLDNIILNRSPFLLQLLSGLRETLRSKGKGLYKIIKPDLGISKSIQEEWFQTIKGIPRFILQLFPQIVSNNFYTNIKDKSSINNNFIEGNDTFDDYLEKEATNPGSISNKLYDENNIEHKYPIPKKFAPKLIDQALLIGLNICPERLNLRDAVLTGLAALEISQLITNWVKRKNNTNSTEESIFPSFELILSLITSWLRFSYPIFPIFPSRGFSHSSENIQIAYSGIPYDQSQFDTYCPLYLQKIVDSIVSNRSSSSDNFSQFFKSKIDLKRPETIISFIKSPITVKLASSNAQLYLKPENFGSYDFGLIISEDEVERDRKYDELSNLWESIVSSNEINLNVNKISDLKEIMNMNLLKDIFKFWFNWILTQPLLSFSTAAGQIAFAALIHAFFGLAVDDGMPVDSELNLRTFLSNDYEQFMNEMMAKLTVKYVGNEFEEVIDKLPDMQYRTAILLDVIDDEQ